MVKEPVNDDFGLPTMHKTCSIQIQIAKTFVFDLPPASRHIRATTFSNAHPRLLDSQACKIHQVGGHTGRNAM